MKTCFKCGDPQPIGNFYRHAGMADGHLNKCKACTKSDVAKHREENIDKVRQYDRERGKLPHRKELLKKLSAAPHRRAAAVALHRNWRQEDRRRMKCHNAVARAVKSGRLVRQPCPCGEPNSHAHHEDYDRPLDVTWLCAACHSRHHHPK